MSQCQNIDFMKGAPPQQQHSPLHPYSHVWHFHAEWHPCGLSLKDALIKISESFKDWLIDWFYGLILRKILWIDLMENLMNWSYGKFYELILWVDPMDWSCGLILCIDPLDWSYGLSINWVHGMSS